MGLRGRISLYAIIGIVGLSLVYIAAVQVAIRRTSDIVLSERLLLTKLTAQSLDTFLRHFTDMLGSIAQQEKINLEDNDLEPERHIFREIYPTISMISEEFVLLNAEGEVLLKQPESDRQVAVLGLSDDLGVKKTLSSGKPGIYTYAESPFSGVPTVVFHYPVKNLNNRITGLLWAGMRLPSPLLQELLRQLKPGMTGYGQLLDDKYFVVSSTRADRLFIKSEHSEALSKLDPPMKATIVQDYDLPEGQEFSIAVAPLASANWKLIVEQEPWELFWPVTMLRRRLIFIGAVALTLALAFIFVSTRKFLRPVLELTKSAREIASGRLDTPVVATGPAEVGVLSSTFEEMRKRLKESADDRTRSHDELEERVKKRTKELSLLSQVASTIIQTIDLEEMLQRALESTIAAFEANAGIVFLVDLSGKLIATKVAKGISEKSMSVLNSIRLDGTMASRALNKKAPVACLIGDYPDPDLKLLLIEEGLASVASAPLIAKDEAIGSITILSRKKVAFSPDEMSNLAAVASQIAVALENALLFQHISMANEELKIAMQKFKEAQASAMRAEKMAAVGRMGAGLVHELKQPLSILSMRLEMMSQDAELGSTSRKQVGILSDQVRRMLKIVDNLRRFSRQEKPEITPVEINRAIEDVLSLVEYDLGSGNIKLVKELDQGAPIIYADSDQLSQVFLNLISNARDAMPGGGGLTVKTEKFMEKDEEWVRITFSDTGCGIPEEELGQIFDPFFTTKPPDKGTGLGLSVCLGIIESHGGIINVKSEVGKGTSMIIELPLGEPTSAP